MSNYCRCCTEAVSVNWNRTLAELVCLWMMSQPTPNHFHCPVQCSTANAMHWVEEFFNFSFPALSWGWKGFLTMRQTRDWMRSIKGVAHRMKLMERGQNLLGVQESCFLEFNNSPCNYSFVCSQSLSSFCKEIFPFCCLNRTQFICAMLVPFLQNKRESSNSSTCDFNP